MKYFIILLLTFYSCTKNSGTKSPLLNLIEDIEFKVYFSYPDRDESKENKFMARDRIISLIRNSKFKIDIYAYTFDNPLIIEELKIAKNRGVQIRFLLDADKDYTELQKHEFNYRIWRGRGLHHIKAIIFDRDIIFYGTGNFGKVGLINNWNGYIEHKLRDSEKIINHLEEISEEVFYEDNYSTFLFSPQNGLLIQEEIIESIEKAKESIYYLTFDHYDEIISHALKKASSRGVEVIGIYNSPIDPEGKYLNSEFFGLSSSIYKDGNLNSIPNGTSFPDGGLLHHKTIIIDKYLLLTGSYNFSKSARDKNREMFVKINHPFVVQSFLEEFERIKKHSYRESRLFKNFSIKDHNISSINPVNICGNEFKEGIWENKLGIFSTYILKKNNSDPNNCYSYKEKDSISTGISNMNLEKTLQEENLWNGARFYGREGEDIYSTNPIDSDIEKLSNFKFFPIKSYEFLRSGNLLLELNDEIYPNEIYFFSPGKKLIKINNFTISKKEITINENFSSGERNNFMIFFYKPDITYYNCIKSKSETIDYLIRKIKWRQKDKNTIECME